MILKTKEFQQVCNTILLATGENAANLELKVEGNDLLLNVTNREYYVSCKFALSQAETFRAVVDASLFLSLISGITTETVEVVTKDNTVVVKSGKSSYKLAMAYENTDIMSLPKIEIENKTVEMSISNDILQSILNVNGKEISKGKALNVSELQKLYYITEEGCFTFVTSACLNAFTLEKPVRLLLNDRIVKLFKLFKEDVHFVLGNDTFGNDFQTKVIFETPTIYLAAIITNDAILLNKVQAPYAATKASLEHTEKYNSHLVLSTKALSESISRLMTFTKNSTKNASMLFMPATCTVSQESFEIEDQQGNVETVQVENDSISATAYSMILNLSDLKFILDSCKEPYITLNCDDGKHSSVVVTKGNVTNLIQEGESA